MVMDDISKKIPVFSVFNMIDGNTSLTNNPPISTSKQIRKKYNKAASQKDPIFEI